MEQSEHRVLVAIAEAATPPGRRLAAIDGATLAAQCRPFVERMAGDDGWSRYRAALRALDLATLPTHGARLSRLPFHEREEALRRLSRARATFWMVRLLLAPIRVARWDGASLSTELGSGVEARAPLSVVREPTRWERQMQDARALEEDELLEAEAVVVGTGAGGAAAAHALARRGHAVVMLEAGAYFSRADFVGSPWDRQRKLYYAHGATTTVGNTIIPLPLGKTVGGTTTVNSGTCYRTPAAVQRRWELELGLRDLRPGALDPYFDRVEAMLGVAEGAPEHLNGSAATIARGCEALGYAHGPLRRNAPDCDGQGVCCFGCPTDAKRSTNVSYVPAALERGAVLFHHATVTEILVEGGQAVGVVARARREDGTSVRLTVRADAVVLACGTVHTPLLLQRNALCGSSGQLGRNLTIHPVGYALGVFDEPIRGWNGIPQGYAIEEFADQGIRFEGGFIPPEMLVATLTQVGHEWTELVEQMEHIASFGFMLAERSRGRVLARPDGKPLIHYDLCDEDVLRMIQGMATLSRVYLAAGARAVTPGVEIFDRIRSAADVDRLEREGPGLLAAHHFDLTAYHPLGTCRMGADPTSSVVSPEHETHEVEGLFVADGSTVPGPLGVNPQVTIMAFGERAADFVERRIERGVARPVSVALAVEPAPAVRFAETMAGRARMVDASGDEADRQVVFHVDASLEPAVEAWMKRRSSTMRLRGELLFEGLASHVPCEGTLQIHPLRTTATLVYDLHFTADDGRPMTLHGEKHVGPGDLLSGMTTLYTEIRDRAADRVVSQGVLRFDLADLVGWLRSFRLAG